MARTGLYRLLDTNGDGTGTKNASVDGSITPVRFKFQPAVGQVAQIERMVIHIEDVGGFDSGKYGNNIVLTNGIDVCVRNKSDDSVLLDLLDGLTVTTNHDWGTPAYDLNLWTFGTGNEGMFVRWTFGKSGRPLEITENEYLYCTINDDLTGLVEHFFFLEGQWARGAPLAL